MGEIYSPLLFLICFDPLFRLDYAFLGGDGYAAYAVFDLASHACGRDWGIEVFCLFTGIVFHIDLLDVFMFLLFEKILEKIPCLYYNNYVSVKMKR